ncbi:hypothetical protein L210DRAFT_2185642 [Boletus edulis BED1]|uniref:Uncharacterized protein n=1 Tax=Boletus edulis BED1 TaxID=1328754 RepID=A0AAD4BTU6_BOLED|nr:hypothetical protein L210DRAFT_2185642 [Boletus edulis BED1]
MLCAGKMGQSRDSDPSVQPNLTALISNIIHLLLGVYGWEYLVSLHVEWALVCGQLAFRPSLIPYLLGRTCTLIYLILHAVGRGPYSKSFSCISSTFALALTANIAVGCSSTNFMIRTWVIWRDSRLVHALLLFLALGHWTMLAIDVVNIRAINVGHVCDLYLNHPQMDAITLIYTMGIDCLVLVLLVVGLSSQRSKSPLKKCLRVQGILYCAVAGVSYISTVVVVLLHNPAVFDLISDLAVVVITIVSSRAVISLRSLAACGDSEYV